MRSCRRRRKRIERQKKKRKTHRIWRHWTPTSGRAPPPAANPLKEWGLTDFLLISRTLICHRWHIRKCIRWWIHSGESVSVIVPNLCGGPEEVCPASCSQGHDHPVPGDQGPQGHGERHVPHLLPAPGEGGRQEGGSLLSYRTLIADPFVPLNPFLQ